MLGKRTLTEKILSKATGVNKPEKGEIYFAKPDLVMMHDITSLPAINLLKEIGKDKVWNPEKIIVVFDHQSPPSSIQAAENQKKIREFVEQQGIKNFYDVGEGICHQILPEKGYISPGMFIVGGDSHTTTYGALGAFSTGIGHTDLAAILATGELWVKMPETMEIKIEGKKKNYLTSKDIILHVIGEIGAEGANYKSVEFKGETVKEMDVSERMTISNMAVEMGAKAGIIEPDEKTIQYLKGRAKFPVKPLKSDPEAEYDEKIKFNIENLEPQVAVPHTVDNIKSVNEVEGVPINQAFLGSCTNGRLKDMELAAKMLKGRKIDRKVRFIVSPASRKIYLEMERGGVLETLLKAGAIVTNPGCTVCIGGHVGLLAAGEVAISSSNRNFRGRMGSPKAYIYLASPLTVTASAINGEITDPRRYLK